MARDLRKVYTAAKVEAAAQAIDDIESAWNELYPMSVMTWRSSWENVTPFFAYPEPIRKVIYLAISRASQRWTMPIQD